MANDTDSHESHPSLPREIINDIVDRSVATHHPATLSSMALVSQYCRIQANEKRFSAIHSEGTVDPRHIPERFTKLAVIVQAQSSVPGMLNMASFITYFQYRNGGMSAIPSPFIGGAMTIIFKVLFRPSPYYTPSSKDFVLNLDPSGERHADGVSWDKFHPTFTAAFIDLCRNSRLTELWLSNIRCIPSGILRYSTVKHLRVDHVTIELSRDVAPQSNGQIMLESLHIYGFVSFGAVVRILCGRDHQSPTLFSRLKEVRTVLCSHEDINITNQVLANATAVETLTLSLRPIDSFNNHPGFGTGPYVRFGHLASLKKLCLLNLFDFRLESGISPSNLVGGALPAQLEEIGIFISDHIASDEVGELFQDNDLANVDIFFSKSHLNPVKRIVIISQIVLDRESPNYNRDSFKTRCSDYIKAELPRLSQKLSPYLVVRVDIVTVYRN